MNKLERFKQGKIVLHTPTIEIYEKLLKWCNSKGMRWVSGVPALKNYQELWKNYRERTCIEFSAGSLSYSDLDYYEGNESVIETLTEQDFPFTKDNLQSGMIVTTRNSQLYFVLRGDMETRHYGKQDLIFIKKDAFLYGSAFSNDLKCEDGKCFDIVKVHKPYVQSSATMFCLDENLVWERDLGKGLRKTIENIEKELAEVKQELAELA